MNLVSRKLLADSDLTTERARKQCGSDHQPNDNHRDHSGFFEFGPGSKIKHQQRQRPRLAGPEQNHSADIARCGNKTDQANRDERRHDQRKNDPAKSMQPRPAAYL